MNVAVIGAGVMGTGVAHNMAQYGISTNVVDISQSQLDKCRQMIEANLRLYNFHPQHKKKTHSTAEIMENIRFTTELDDIVECDLVIENITEDIEKKNALYTRMNTICGASTVFGVNTSAISITALSKFSRRPFYEPGTADAHRRINPWCTYCRAYTEHISPLICSVE